MKIGADTKWGRVKVEMPDGMSPEDRAAVFKELAAMELAPKKPFSFGDLSLRKAVEESAQ